MTARELINDLVKLNPDTKVMIGIFQERGSDFAYDIRSICTDRLLSPYYGRDTDNVAFLIESLPIGTMELPDDDYDEEV